MIGALLATTERNEGYVLKPEERKFILDTYPARLRRQLTRFVVGAKKHADERWSETNFLRAMTEELDDALNYIDGHKVYVNNRRNLRA